MTGHDHSTCSNTDEVFRTFIGCKVGGMLRDSCGETRNAVVLVFECGWGLAFNSNGAHWTVTPDGVREILERAKKELDHTKKELEHVLALAGEVH